MVVGCETIEEVEDLAGRVRKVPVPGELSRVQPVGRAPKIL